MKKKYICMSLMIYSLSNVYLGEAVFADTDKVEFQTNNETNNYLKKSDKIVRDTSEYPYEIENIYDSDENEYFSLQPKSTKQNTDVSDDVATDARISWLLKNYQEDQQFSQDLSKEEQKAATQIAIWHYTDPETTPISSQIVQDNPAIKNLIEEADKYKNDTDILNTNTPRISNRSVRSNENTCEITYTINNGENTSSEIDSIRCYAVTGGAKTEVTNSEGLNIIHDDSGSQISLTVDNELADSFGEDVLFELEVDYNLECESYSGKVYNTSDNSKRKQKQKNQLLLGSETNTIKTKAQLSDSCEVGKGDSDTSYEQDHDNNSSCGNNGNGENNSQGENGSCGNNGNGENNSQGENGSCGNNGNGGNNSQGENGSCGNNGNGGNNSQGENGSCGNNGNGENNSQGENGSCGGNNGNGGNNSQGENGSCGNNGNGGNNSQGENGSNGNNGNGGNNSQGENGSNGNNGNGGNNSQDNNGSHNNENGENNSNNVVVDENDYDINVDDATGELADNENETNDFSDNINEDTNNETENQSDIGVDTVVDDEYNHTSDSIVYEVDNATGNNNPTSDDTASNDAIPSEADNTNANEDYLPSTGTKHSYILSVLGGFLLVLLSSATYKKKKTF